MARTALFTRSVWLGSNCVRACVRACVASAAFTCCHQHQAMVTLRRDLLVVRCWVSHCKEVAACLRYVGAVDATWQVDEAVVVPGCCPRVLDDPVVSIFWVHPVPTSRRNVVQCDEMSHQYESSIRAISIAHSCQLNVPKVACYRLGRGHWRGVRHPTHIHGGRGTSPTPRPSTAAVSLS